MIKNLLALLLALQKATLDANQRLLLTQLGNKLEAISRKSSAPKEDWDVVQAKINQLLEKNSTLAEQYQQFSTQLLTWTDEKLATLLPSPDVIRSLQPHPPAVLGYRASDPLYDLGKDEVTNIVICVSRDENPSEKSKEVIPPEKVKELFDPSNSPKK